MFGKHSITEPNKSGRQGHATHAHYPQPALELNSDLHVCTSQILGLEAYTDEISSLKNWLKAREMAQWEKVSATKSDSLSWTLRTHIVKRENQFLQNVL